MKVISFHKRNKIRFVVGLLLLFNFQISIELKVNNLKFQNNTFLNNTLKNQVSKSHTTMENSLKTQFKTHYKITHKNSFKNNFSNISKIKLKLLDLNSNSNFLKSNSNVNPTYVTDISAIRNNPYQGSNSNRHFEHLSINSINKYSASGSSYSNSSSNFSAAGSIPKQLYNDSKGEATNFSNSNRVAVSNGYAQSPPVDTSYLEHSTKPRYVEKLGFYDTDIPSQKHSEAISVTNPLSNDYYQPFTNKLIASESPLTSPVIESSGLYANVGAMSVPSHQYKPLYDPVINNFPVLVPGVSDLVNCSGIPSPLACQTTGNCVWDKYANLCTNRGLPMSLPLI